MNTRPKGYAEKMPLFYAVTQEILAVNPALRPLSTGTSEEYIRIVASLLAEGNCGLMVYWGGRAAAVCLLERIAQMEYYDTCLALQDAIERGYSIHDNKGEVGLTLETPTYVDWLAGSPEASEEATEVDPFPSVERLCHLMQQVHSQHRAALPAELFEPQYASLGLGSSQAPAFEEFALQLHYGLIGGVVDQLGRVFCRHVLASLESIGACVIYGALRRAVEYGTSNWDNLGYLPPDSPETNLLDCSDPCDDVERI